MAKKKEPKKDVITFNPHPVPFFEGKTIGLWIDKSTDQIWFHGPDVARLLGYTNASHMYRMIDDENQALHIVEGVNKGVNQLCTSISEAGFYQVALLSRVEKGKKLMNWVCTEVLPSIRKNGTFISDTATTEEVKFALENKIVGKCMQRARGKTVRIPPLIEQLLDIHSLEHIRKVSLPYLNEQLSGKNVKGVKDIMFDTFADTVKNWGNSRFLAKKLDMPDQYMVMALMKECEEKRGIYLKSSRSQRVRQLQTKLDQSNKEIRR